MTRRGAALDGQVLLSIQRAGGPARPAALALSHAGEHALAWLAASAAGAALDAPRRGSWVRAGAAALGAHAAAVVLKRVVRRPRPDVALLSGLVLHGSTLSGLSFPSAHAASTTAFAVAMSPALGRPVLALPPAMGAARVLLGAHFPSDVLVGTALGAAVGGLVRR